LQSGKPLIQQYFIALTVIAVGAPAEPPSGLFTTQKLFNLWKCEWSHGDCFMLYNHTSYISDYIQGFSYGKFSFCCSRTHSLPVSKLRFS